ncbi:hypothetical protein CFIO01_09990 [Colletotrichum fioriniae PJ7]|uniref:Short-chain dehydrogenase n=1 Tax=Colletotrichum fioriniae PJ7 TaxID=1445577 RepID=A0A010QJV0_9PEZI|nr:hypothetical protein CFIO01_09990 [Colletotrichum fioriniae PJ7]
MTPSFNDATRASDLVQFYSEQIVGKTILITGPSPGSLVDSYTRQVAARKPSMIILASRSLSKIQDLINDINNQFPSVKVKSLPLNLLSLSDVRKAAERLKSWSDVPDIDVLVNNAGIMAVPYAFRKGFLPLVACP